MSNALPARLRSLTFRAADLQRSDLSVHFDVVSGLNDGLDVRGRDSIVPSAEGQRVRIRMANTRSIILPGTIQGVGSTEALRLASAQNLRDELEDVFDPLIVGTLIGQAADGTWRQIDCRPQPGIIWTPTPIMGVETTAILFVSIEPHWQVTGGGS